MRNNISRDMTGGPRFAKDREIYSHAAAARRVDYLRSMFRRLRTY